tara:strand:+ start:1380 stop:3320 length:1941 start_codon:yes stop_codon:yes gene_type:complete
MVYGINYGFRALLDWQAGKPKRRRNINDLLLKTFPPEKKPIEKQGQTSRRIPGKRGMFFDVSNIKRPPMQKNEDKEKALAGNVGQWVYLLAEKMKTESLQAVLDSMEDSRKRWEIEDEEMKQLEAIAFDPVVTFGSTDLKTGYKKQVENSPMFQQMFTGLGTGSNWMQSYVANVASRGPTEIKKMSKLVEKHLVSFRGSVLGKETFAKGPEIDINDVGQTIQEKIITGRKSDKTGGFIATSPDAINWGPDFESKRKDYSKPIDLEFTEEIQVPRGPTFKRMDVTSSFFLDPQTGATTGHHGTGKGYRFDMAWTTKHEAEEGIERMQSNQLTTYNNIMKLIIDWAKRTGRAGAGKTPNLQQLRDYLPTKSRIDGWVKQNLIPNLGDPALDGIRAEIGNMTKGDLVDTFIWVMHHMGNMLPGQAENYANTMSIVINGQHATLILVYEIDDKGMYQKVHANIFEEETPLQWLVSKAHELGVEGTFEEILQEANASLAAEGLQGVKSYGVLSQVAEAFLNSVHPRISMTKLMEPKFSAVLENVVNKVFENIHKSLHESMVKGLREQTLTFSKWAANPSNLGDIPEWYEWAASTILTDNSDAPDMKGDPFWFLWAAPYVSGGFRGVGGGIQTTGDHPRMAKLTDKGSITIG